ncbi:DUF6458 family protein [Microbacterium sp. NPDC055903]
MGIGTGVALFVIGAILTFAIDVEVAWADLDIIGYILMGAGVVVFLISVILLARRRRTDIVTRTDVDPTVGEQVTRRAARTDDGTI